MNKIVIPTIALFAFLMFTFATACSTIPDEKEAMDFAKKQTTRYDSVGHLVAAEQKEKDEAFILFYSEKFASAVLKNDLEKAAQYAERVTVFHAVNNDMPQRDRWIGISKLVEQKKMDELRPIAEQLEADFAKAKK